MSFINIISSHNVIQIRGTTEQESILYSIISSYSFMLNEMGGKHRRKNMCELLLNVQLILREINGNLLTFEKSL